MIEAAIRRGLTAAEQVESERARLRGDIEAMFLLVGMAGLDLIVTQERQRLAERYAGRMNLEGFVK